MEVQKFRLGNKEDSKPLFNIGDMIKVVSSSKYLNRIGKITNIYMLPDEMVSILGHNEFSYDVSLRDDSDTVLMAEYQIIPATC